MILLNILKFLYYLKTYLIVTVLIKILGHIYLSNTVQFLKWEQEQNSQSSQSI